MVKAHAQCELTCPTKCVTAGVAPFFARRLVSVSPSPSPLSASGPCGSTTKGTLSPEAAGKQTCTFDLVHRLARTQRCSIQLAGRDPAISSCREIQSAYFNCDGLASASFQLAGREVLFDASTLAVFSLAAFPALPPSLCRRTAFSTLAAFASMPPMPPSSPPHNHRHQAHRPRGARARTVRARRRPAPFHQWPLGFAVLELAQCGLDTDQCNSTCCLPPLLRQVLQLHHFPSFHLRV